MVVVGVVLSVIALAGCGEHAANGPNAQERGQAASTVPGSPGADPSKVSVDVVDENGLKAALAQRKGKVVLVDFWATWCEPCRELLPHTIQLQRDFGSKGLDVISLSLDDPEEESAVLGFLVSKGAEIENFISQYGTSPRSMTAFGISDGSLPHLKLYDRQGALYRTFRAGEFQPADIDRAVEELLNKS